MEIESTPTSGTGSAGTAGNASQSLNGLASDFNNFLTLLTTQLQNQDPLSPTDTNEFTNQLVQFANVEQQVKQNSNLEKLIDLQSQNQAVGALAYLGNTIEASGNTNALINGQATFSYFLPESASAAQVQIFNAAGDLVFQDQVPTESGIHDIVWDGAVNQNGAPAGTIAPDGVYSFLVTAVDSKDLPVDVSHSIVGQVTGVSFEDGKTVLGIGDVAVPLDVVSGVLEPRTTTEEPPSS